MFLLVYFFATSPQAGMAATILLSWGGRPAVQLGFGCTGMVSDQGFVHLVAEWGPWPPPQISASIHS